MPRWGKKNDGDTALRTMMEDLKQQQSQLVDSIKNEKNGSDLRVSCVLSDLETYMSKLETIIERLANVTEALVEQSDAAQKPWYVRIFCP